MATVITMRAGDVDELDEIGAVMGEWQREGEPVQLHPGDLGWFARLGATATAAAVRTWRRDGRPVAVGLLDGPDLVRMAMAPEVRDDTELAARIADDLGDPDRGVLPAGEVGVEAWHHPALGAELKCRGWRDDEEWTPLRRDLGEPVPDAALRIVTIGPPEAHLMTEVLRASFERSTFTDERWRAMSATAPHLTARSLVGLDADGAAVATTTVWSAGPGRPGLVEPMGVHRDHRGRGYGRAITLAGAAALRELGASGALVATRSANVAAVTTYESAGFVRLDEVRDLRRSA